MRESEASGADDIVIRPIDLADIAGFRDCVGVVMRERRYLAYLDPGPLEDTASFVARNLRLGNPHVVAGDRGRIVG